MKITGLNLCTFSLFLLFDKFSFFNGKIAFGYSGQPIDVDYVTGFADVTPFYTDYIFLSKPLLMKNAAIFFPAFTLWTDDYLNSTVMPGTEVKVEKAKKENRSGETELYDFHEFLNFYNKTNQDLYLVSDIPENIRQDLLLPDPLQCRELYENHLVSSTLWFSNGGTKSVIHTDDMENIQCVLDGFKKYVLVDPVKYGDYITIDDPVKAYSYIDVDDVDFEKYPELTNYIEYHHVTLNAGDCLYIPYRWIHQVNSYGSRNVAVNIWWDHHGGKSIDVEHCANHQKSTITLNDVEFISFEEREDTEEKIRDQYYYYSLKVKNLQLDTFITLNIKAYGDIENFHLIEENVIECLTKIFKIMDMNRDNSLHPNEVLAVTDQVWSTILDFVDDILDDIDSLYPPDDDEMDEEYIVHDEL